jgi:tetratricopeptide (TPR) repeat protein
LNNLGLEPLQRRARLAQVRYGPENFISATIMSNLAILTGEDGDLVRERELLDQALAIQKKTLGPNHPLVASTLNSIGATLLQTGDYPSARDHYQRALVLLQQKDGEKSPKTLEVMLSLADVEHEMSDFLLN